ncbi:MAG TPA: uracil-DNA glycosylase family protein [Bacteroidales bacterium]|nr:uracil-DNA glycosylase family protein [Bacteroidales bacterium]
MDTFAEKIISFCLSLDFNGSLPEGISVMNPFRNNPRAMAVVSQFYRNFYSDNKERRLILGINPGRFGAGVTGIPFTDTVRLKEKCGLVIPGLKSFETSSVFIYEMIDKYGGPEKFYSDFYISSVSPLGFTLAGKGGKETNYNYYDSKQLTEAIKDFAVLSLKQQLAFGIKRDVCFCLGTGKNFKYLTGMNDELRFFKEIVPLEHPRFIMQYKSGEKNSYINRYIEKLQSF